MVKNWVILAFLILIVLSSGCVNQPPGPPEYKDDALKLETEVPDKTYPDQIVNVKVVLTNQVENDITNITLRITDFYGLTLIDQNCSYDGENLKDLKDCGFISAYCGCTFKSIQSLDDREINFAFKVPGEDELARIGRDLKPEISLSYDYFGETGFFVPILSITEKSTKAKIRTTQTKGPIHVEIERGLTQSSDQWERPDVRFPIIVWVKDVIKSDSERMFDKRSLNMILMNLKTAEGGKCDFDSRPLADTFILTPKENITLPMKTPLICTLVGFIPEGMPRTDGAIIADYDYTYTIVETESITVETEVT